MKKLTVLLSVVFAASLAYAGDAKDAAKDAKADVKASAHDAKADAKSAAHKLSHEVEAEVVAVDSAKGTITIKTEKGESSVPVEGKAIADAKTVKPGQKVTLVCRDDEKGEHKAVAEIKTKTTSTDKK